MLSPAFAGKVSETKPYDGNKRVAAAITEAILKTNGFEPTMANDENRRIVSRNNLSHFKA